MRKPPQMFLEPDQIKGHAKLERLLRSRFRKLHHSIQVGSVRGFGGGVEYNDAESPVEIVWDPFNYDVLSLTIHEMLHPPLEEPLKAVGLLEESSIEGICTVHALYVRRSKSRYRWWKNAIRSMLTVEGFRRWLKEQGDD